MWGGTWLGVCSCRVLLSLHRVGRMGVEVTEGTIVTSIGQKDTTAVRRRWPEALFEEERFGNGQAIRCFGSEIVASEHLLQVADADYQQDILN